MKATPEHTFSNKGLVEFFALKGSIVNPYQALPHKVNTMMQFTWEYKMLAPLSLHGSKTAASCFHWSSVSTDHWAIA